MTNTNQTARKIAKKLIIEHGNGILNKHITAAYEAAGIELHELTNALDYFKYSPAQSSFRARYGYGA